MSTIDWRTLNLNLLPALAALLQERAVGRAARRVGVSQSAMSHSLAKLRELLGDPLLVAHGRGLTLTPRAHRLAETLPGALDGLREALREPARFDPARAEATFTIATVDYFEITALPSLLAWLATHAPGVRLCIERLHAGSFDGLRSGHVDLVLGGGVLGNHGGLRQTVLYRDPFKVIARRGHPGLGRRLTLDAYLRHEHVVVRFEGHGPAAVDRALARSHRERRVGLTVPHFGAAPLAVAATDMLCTIASVIAAQLAEPLGLQVFEPPIDVGAAPVSMVWAAATEHDAPRRWFRELLASGVAAPPSLRRLLGRDRTRVAPVHPRVAHTRAKA